MTFPSPGSTCYCVSLEASVAAKSARLLYVVNDARFFLSHRLTLALAAAQTGYQIHVATPDSPAVERIRKFGFVFHPVLVSRRGMHPIRELSSLCSLYRLYRSLQPDLVHHVTIKPVLYGGIAARLAGVPAVVSAVTGLGHVFVAKGHKAAFLRFFVKLAYRFALGHPNSKVILQNPDDRLSFTAAKLVTAESAVLIKGAGVDTREFVPAPEAEKSLVVLLAARMLWSKGVSEFVHAARQLRAEGLHARFVLVGTPDEGNPLAVPSERLREWDRSGVVEWWGYRNDMPAVFAQAHVVCLPTTYGEGVPKVLIEAAACARAIVATDVPGCREIVLDGETGLLVPPQNVSALAEGIRTLLENPERRRTMGQRGREIVEREFAIEKVVRETLAVYRTLVALP